MQQWRRSALVAFICLAASASPAQAKDESQQVQEDVRTIIHAVYDGDLDAVLRFTHPKVIEMQGGEAATRSAVEQAVQQLKAMGMHIESLSFPKPPEFLEGGGRRFVIVPTLSVIVMGDQRAESLNFQLGVLEPRATHWVYVEGSRVNRENVQSLFPGFPEDYEFPPFYRMKL